MNERRNSLLLLVALGLLLILAAIGFVHMQRQQWAVEDEKEAAEEQLRFAKQQRERAEAQLSLSRQHLYVSNMNLAASALRDGNLPRASELVNAYLPNVGPEKKDDLRSFYWYYLWRRLHPPARATLKGFDEFVNSAVFSSDGKLLAAVSYKGMVKLWDVMTLEEVATLPDYVSTVVFSADNKILAVASGTTVKLWDIAGRRELASLRAPQGRFVSVALSPDGRMLAAGDEDKKLHLVDAATGRTTALLEGHKEAVGEIAFSPDAEIIATGSWDRTVKLWHARTHEVLATWKIVGTYCLLLRLLAGWQAVGRGQRGHDGAGMGCRGAPPGREFKCPMGPGFVGRFLARRQNACNWWCRRNDHVLGLGHKARVVVLQR